MSSVPKRTKTEANTEVNLSSIDGNDDIADSTASTPELGISGEVVTTCIDVFTEDILPEILDNIGTPRLQDLLNFRLVNRRWRDAATSVLLKRNVCELALDFGQVSPNKSGLPSYNYFKENQPHYVLSDLSQIMTSSPKFPCTSICFLPECSYSFGNLCRPASDINNDDEEPHQKELFHFLSLHGKKFKKLLLSSKISKKAVQNLLYIHMPNLTCLDITEFYEFSLEDQSQEGRQIPVCLPPPSTLEIREILMEYGERGEEEIKFNFVLELINVCPNLSVLKKVDVLSLQALLEIKKSHLIQDLHFSTKFFQMSTVPQLTQLLIDTILSEDELPSLKLSHLTVRLDPGIPEYGSKLNTMVKILNMILSACKDSLKSVTFHVNTTDKVANIFIPPLPHLKSLKLFNDSDQKFRPTTQFYFLGDVIGDAIRAGETIADQPVYDSLALNLQNQSPGSNSSNIPADYFPSLRKVKLYSSGMRNDAFKLLEFFSLEQIEPDGVTTIPGDTLKTVTNLELIGFRDCDKNMSKLFPNVLNLTMSHCLFSSINLQDWVKTVFPNLKGFVSQQNPMWDRGTKVVHSIHF